MTIWIIEPHDPIIVRDGRPFNPTPGVQATSLAFPFPSTTTGGVRTRAGLVNGSFDKSSVSAVLHIQVRGPLLVQLGSHDNNEVKDWFFPAPADALLFPNGENVLCKQLVPLKFDEGAYTNLNKTEGNNGIHQLAPVGLPLSDSNDSNKPAKDAPRFWKKTFFEQWLKDPSSIIESVERTHIGHNGPEREQRMHVSIDAERLVASEGALFGTSGLEFTHSEQHNIQNAQRLALVVAVDGENADAERRVQTMSEGLAGFGGERRMVSWRKSTTQLPSCPKEVQNTVAEKKACRVILLTPACFKEGYYPTKLTESRNGVTPKIEAIAIQRPQIVSGWDLAVRGPKPTRRLAPTGTVLFLSLRGSDEDIKSWVADTWMRCVSDEDQDNKDQYNKDGFGLAVVGMWSGKPVAMQ